MSFTYRALIAVIALAAFVACGCAQPYLINAQQSGYRSRPEYIRDHLAHIETLPFDGLVVTTATGARLMNGARCAPDEIARDFAPLQDLAFVRMQHNFAWVNVDRPADFFGDWSATVENFRAFARALKACGLKGIFFDNEEYARTLFNYPEDCSDRSKSLADYRKQAELRGRQIAEAIAAEYPELVMVVLHGPYSSHALTPDAVRAGQTDWESEELRGPFTVGLIKGMDSRARLVDGGELYAYRTAADFELSYDYRKHTLASAEADCPFISPALRAVWAQKTSVAFGLSNHPFPAGAMMNPATLRSALEHALRRCDDYVWLNFEGESWNAPGEVASEWIDAVVSARAATTRPPQDPVSVVSVTSPPAGSTFVQPTALTLRANVSSPADTLVKVEFFTGTEKLGEVTSTPWTVVWPAPTPGLHTITALAIRSSGVSTRSSEVPITISTEFVARINFQPMGVTPPPGYFADTGAIYDDRGNGLTYGWNENHGSDMRHREQIADLRQGTLCQMREDGIWEMAVPNGIYEVTASVGDGAFPSTHTLYLEGVAFFDGLALASGQFVARSRTVVVADGRLTLDQGTASHEQTRLNYLVIAASNARTAFLTGLIAVPVSSGAVELHWLDHNSTEAGFIVEQSSEADFSDAVTLAILPPDAVTSIDAAPTPGTMNYYRVRVLSDVNASTAFQRSSATVSSADTDRDDIPDEQETAPCVVGVDDSQTDSDGDGYSNAAERLAGTGLTDPNSFPRIAELSTASGTLGVTASLSFMTEPNRNYFLDYCDSLSEGVWTRLQGSARFGDSTLQSVDNLPVLSGRFYRLRISR